MWKSAAKTVLLCFVGGLMYCLLEVLWKGSTHWSMFVLAALLSLPLDQINEHLRWDSPLWFQAFAGGAVITLAELTAGLILNCYFGLGVWDYSKLPGNILGQISPQYSTLWVILALFAIILFDYLRWWLFGEEKPHYTWR